MHKVAILQSNYIPWKGYFDIINMVDLFMFYDDVQYTVRDWRNRNKIKTEKGVEWLTVPCGSDRNRLICEVRLDDHTWQKSHWDKIQRSYRKAQYFDLYKGFFEDFYLCKQWESLSDMNQYLVKKISIEILGIRTVFDDSRKYHVTKQKDERIRELLKQVHATEYLSGPSAKTYLNEDDLMNANIAVTWMDYTGYSEYRQLFPPFVNEVSIIDLIFNEGPDATKYMKSFQKGIA